MNPQSPLSPARLTKIGTIGALAALLAISGASAKAQEVITRRTIAPTPPAAGGGGGAATSSRVTMKQTADDGRKVLVELRNGKVVTATIDGEEVGSDRVKHDGDAVWILDGDGREVYRWATAINPPTAPTAPLMLDTPMVYQLDSTGGRAKLRTFVHGEGGAGAFGGTMVEQDAEPPPVMVGVSLADPDRSLRKHFNLEPGQATMLLSVYEGLPAADAGLRSYDVIIGLRGKSASPADLRGALRSAEPGDELPLTVIQDGKRKEVVVKLRAYDRKKLDEAAAKFREQMEADGEDGIGFFDFNVIAPAPPAPPAFPGGAHGRMDAEHAARLHEQMRHLEVDARARAENARQRAEEVMRHTEGRRAQAGARSEESGEQLERLEERMKRLEALLERLAEDRETKRSGGGN